MGNKKVKAKKELPDPEVVEEVLDEFIDHRTGQLKGS